MTTRSDITYFWPDNPRVAQVDDPSVEFVVQDIVDTFRVASADIGGAGLDAIDDEALLSEATGKDDLGGGVEVGITATGNQVQLAFEARTTPISSSTVTTGDTLGVTLTDITTGTFQTDSVGRGDVVINFTDQSMASVLRVLSETVLEVDGLTGGTDNQFDISDVCKVYDVVQCEISGGNWVSVDSVGDPILSILPTFGTQIVRTSASSATTQQQADIEFASFAGGVWVDFINGTAGTTGDIGKPNTPSNNIPDSITITNSRGLPKKLFIIGDATFITGQDITGYQIEGESTSRTSITIDTGAIVNGVEISDATLSPSSTLDADAILDHCSISTLAFFEGMLHECELAAGTITLGGSAALHVIDCHSGVAGAGTPTMDLNGGGRDVLIRNYSGGINLKNSSAGDNHSIDLISGQVVLDNDITAGVFVIRGVGKLTDNSTGTTIVERAHLVESSDKVLRVVESQRGHHTATGNIFYWDPVNGLDTNDGLAPGTAKLTWGGGSGVNSLVVAQNHDLVILIPGEPVGTTVITEQIVIDKEYTFVRGPGRDIVFRPTATTGETVSVEAVGVELSGVRIETAVTGDGEALVTTGDFSFVHDIWVESSRGDGIRIQNVSHAILKDVIVRDCLGDGVVFRGTVATCEKNKLSDALIINNGGNGVVFEGINCQDNYVWGGEDGVAITKNGGWGILERTNANLNHAVGPVIHIHENTNGEISFTGVDSGAENVGAIEDNVWSKVLEGSFSAEDFMRLMGSTLMGETTFSGGVVTYSAIDDSKVRATITIAGQERISVVLDAA